MKNGPPLTYFNIAYNHPLMCKIAASCLVPILATRGQGSSLDKKWAIIFYINLQIWIVTSISLAFV